MIFETEGVPYKVKFGYGATPYVGKKKKYKGLTQRIVTVIMEAAGVITTGIAYCSPDDTFNKVRGRKVALTKLLEYKRFDWMDNKETRKLFWKEYQQQIKYKD